MVWTATFLPTDHCYGLTFLLATHSSALAWKIPWMEEPGGLKSMGSPGVGHNWATSLSLFTFMHWRRKWQPTPVFLPGESQGRGAWWAAVYGVALSWTRLKRTRNIASPPHKTLIKNFISVQPLLFTIFFMHCDHNCASFSPCDQLT